MATKIVLVSDRDGRRLSTLFERISESNQHYRWIEIESGDAQLAGHL